MKDKIIHLDKHVTEITAEELQREFKGLKNSEIMRSIIINEKEYIRCNELRSLRSFWYSTVKPTLDKLGKLGQDGSSEQDWDGELSRYFSGLVREGIISYKELMIEDESRRREVKPYYSFSPCRNIIICVEKDTVYRNVEKISHLLGCSCYSSKGKSSLGAMESLVRDIRDNSEFEVKQIVLLILSDYDPVGLEIADLMIEHAKIIVKNLGMNQCKVIGKRIGINPEQLTEDELINNCYTPKGNLEKWVKKTNGVNGQAKGLELDALTPDRIREIFTAELEAYIDSHDYYEDRKNSYLYEIVGKSVDRFIGNIVSEIVKEKMEDVVIEDFNIMDYVIADYNYLPTDMCSLANDNIDSLVSDYFIKKVGGQINVEND